MDPYRPTDIAAPSGTEVLRKDTLAQALSLVLAVAPADFAAIRQTTVLQAVSLVLESAHHKKVIPSPRMDGVDLSTAIRRARALFLACAAASMAHAAQVPSTATLQIAIASLECVPVAGTPIIRRRLPRLRR